MIIKEQISSLNENTYLHDVLFKKYENITLYKITNDILTSEGTNLKGDLNKLLTLYVPTNDTNFNKFKYNLTHQPKIYTITKSSYSNINEDYFEIIEGWLDENSQNDMNDLEKYFIYRGYRNDISISSCIFDDTIADIATVNPYNLAPIRITAIEHLSDITKINVNTLAAIYKYLLRINGTSDNPTSEKLKNTLDTLKEKITTISNGFTKESDNSHIEKSLMNQATFKIVAKDFSLQSAAEVLYKSVFKRDPQKVENSPSEDNNLTPGSINYTDNYGIFYTHSPDSVGIDKIYFTNNCDVRYGGLSGNGIIELDDGTRILSYYHHQQKYFYYEDIETEENGKVTATLPTCKIYINLDTCINPANAFGIGYTTTGVTGFYFMVSVKPGFRKYLNDLNDTESLDIRKCLDGSWLDICQFIGINKDNIKSDGLYIGNYLSIRLYSSDDENDDDKKLYPISTATHPVDNALIVSDSDSSGNISWYLNPSCNSKNNVNSNSYNRSKATQFRLAQYYNNGNILGFFAETDEPENATSNDKIYHPLAIYRSDMELPVLMKKQYIRKSGNGKHVWYFSVADNVDENGNFLNKDQFIEYIGFKVIVPSNGYFKIMQSETFYEGNMVNEEGKPIAPTDFTKHSVIPLGRSGVYKYPQIPNN